ncbi:MAG TPA: hypothetical protein VNS63_19625 [Blastocatellia bacterium]|nr:hypothetical protein [Blastocatellia bacterium]
MKECKEREQFSKRTPHQLISVAVLLGFVAASILFQGTSAAQTKRAPKAQPAPEAKEQRRPTGADKVGVLAGEIKDSRTTGSFFAGMEVELKLVGDVLVDAKGMRLTVDAAVDDTGRNLIGEKTEKSEFTEVDMSDKTAASTKVSLKNPVRQATAILELAGSVELFIPARDGNSVATVTNLNRNLGVPISAPALKAAGIDIVIWNKNQFEARKKAEEEKLKKEMAAKRKKDGEGEGDIGDSLADGLQKMFGSLFSGFARMEENSLAFQIADPQSKLVNIEFEDDRGKPIGTNGRMTMGGGKDKTTIYEFSEKLPDAARVRFYVLTSKATIKAPFKLTNVPLP